MDEPLKIATQNWKDTINSIFFESKDKLSDKEISEEQKFNLTFNSREIANFVFGENDYLGYKDPQRPYTDADTPGAIFLEILNKDIKPLLDKTPELKDITEKKIKAVKEVVREIQPIK